MVDMTVLQVIRVLALNGRHDRVYKDFRVLALHGRLDRFYKEIFAYSRYTRCWLSCPQYDSPTINMREEDASRGY